MQKRSDVECEIDVANEYDCARYIEKIIKSNRELFVMSSILETPMCGYDVIKTIFAKYNVFLSQGAIYPILYSLEEERLLYAEYSKGDMRSKKYNLTPRGREFVQENIDEFIKSMDHLKGLLQR